MRVSGASRECAEKHLQHATAAAEVTRDRNQKAESAEKEGGKQFWAQEINGEDFRLIAPRPSRSPLGFSLCRDGDTAFAFYEHHEHARFSVCVKPAQIQRAIISGDGTAGTCAAKAAQSTPPSESYGTVPLRSARVVSSVTWPPLSVVPTLRTRIVPSQSSAPMPMINIGRLDPERIIVAPMLIPRPQQLRR